MYCEEEKYNSKMDYYVDNDSLIYISEYDMPYDFECTWKLESKVYINGRGAKTRVERVYKSRP